MTFTLPEPAEIFDAEMTDGAIIRVRRHGNPDGPRLLLCHGNGFAIDAYFPFWQHLLPGYDVVVYDQRNHGQNPYFGSLGHNIDGFARDLETLRGAIAARFGDKPAAGLYHSVSALTALTHAADALRAGKGWPWQALVLFDPPFIPWPGHKLHERANRGELHLARWAMERPNVFGKIDELVTFYREGKAFSRLAPGAAELMSSAVTTPTDDGGVRLTCPRELEAGIYIANAWSRVWLLLDDLNAQKDRLLYIAADPDLEGAHSPAIINALLPEEFGLNHVAIPGTTHMLQIEEPELCHQAAQTFLEKCGIPPAG